MNCNFGENLRNELDFQGISNKEFSKKADIPLNTLNGFLRKKASKPNLENAVKIAQALNVTVEQLVLGEESKTKSPKPLSREAQEVIKLAQTLTPKQCKAILNLAAEFRGRIQQSEIA